MAVLRGNSVVAVSAPASGNASVLGSILGDNTSLEERKEIIEYIVEEGDTIKSIAAKFDISANTILWANDLTLKSKVKAGQSLIILPVSGVVYQVVKNDTLSSIAKTYKSKVSDIIEFNQLSGEGDIFIGDILIIPNGAMPTVRPSVTQAPIGSSYFICPHVNCHITQGLHWFNATDFAGKCGDPVHAAAEGVVQRAQYGWNSGAGNFVKIIHPNGVTTMYGHLQTVLVVPGQAVSQGDTIGLMGGKPGTPGAGLSTGCHVHFDVSGSKNPFAK